MEKEDSQFKKDMELGNKILTFDYETGEVIIKPKDAIIDKKEVILDQIYKDGFF